ncbi:hypothetical protein SADUNF_Sadunf05G0166900 [Salix dunnii]|uniref:Uncharacterized protein n=1 Tax=Salix dunnii TaxID=1413687 RepID=A0A835N2D9_9ROSI|nr:hypothetical protein SADUNF_Sadunf05G0166900 [Salix dunnii]
MVPFNMMDGPCVQGTDSASRKHNMVKETGHGFDVTFYEFIIDNYFKLNPDEVQPLMDLILEHVEGFMNEESIVNRCGIRVFFEKGPQIL